MTTRACPCTVRRAAAAAGAGRTCTILLLFTGALVLTACSSPNAPAPHASAIAADKTTATPAPTSRALSRTALPDASTEVRALVERFGKKMQEVSTLAPPEAVRGEVSGVYGSLLTPELLAAWKAHPDRVVGRNYGSSPWPSGIEIGQIACGNPDSCHVTGKVDYITSNEVEHGGVFQRRGITLDAAHTAQGWRIAAARLAPETP